MDGYAVISTGIGVIGTVCAIFFGYCAFSRNRKTAEVGAGKEAGMILSELGYVKAGVDDIKKKQDKQDERYIETITRITAVEQSSKQAHKRIDEIVGRETLHE